MVKKESRGGGLTILWKNIIKCKVVNSSPNHINMHNLKKKRSSLETRYYGFPDRERTQEAWDFLRYLAQIDSLPWCIFGDFNDRS